MSEQLYYAVSSGLEENSAQLVMVHNLKKDVEVRGPNAWRAVVQEAVGVNGNRLSGLATQINSPNRVGKYEDVLGALERWTKRRQEYEEATITTLHDASRIVALKQFVPSELEQDQGELKHLTEIEEAKKYVSEQVSIRKEPYFGAPPG